MSNAPSPELTAAPPAPPPPVQMGFTLYRKDTGKIMGRRQGIGGSCITDAIGEVPGIFDGAKFYVDVTAVPPQTVARPCMTVKADKTEIKAGGVDEVQFTGLPANAAVSVDHGAFESIPDGSLTFGAVVPGTYTILFRAFPALDASFKIVVS